ncbi:hypothetical protein BGP_4142 [Beggiatoa sp. PS]|nr:hypothetical protein BGP_4142 [Beggiatoa sp. PS]
MDSAQVSKILGIWNLIILSLKKSKAKALDSKIPAWSPSFRFAFLESKALALAFLEFKALALINLEFFE